MPARRWSPMAGTSWTPATTFAGNAAPQASKVLVRGTFTRADFRAPSLLQEHSGGTALEGINDVTSDPATGEMQTSGWTQTYRAVTTYGDPDLKPQSSNAITAGLEWAPVRGLHLQGDYWRFDYTDVIVKENAPAAGLGGLQVSGFSPRPAMRISSTTRRAAARRTWRRRPVNKRAPSPTASTST